MAPRSYASKAVPASTELLLTLLLFSWMSFLCPNPVQKECLRKSTCILACQAPLCLYWSALWPSDGHRLSKSALHDLALTLGLQRRNFFAALSRIGSGHFWWEPDHHSKSMVWRLGVLTLKALGPTRWRWGIVNCFSKECLSDKSVRTLFSFSSNQVKKLVSRLCIKQGGQKMHWFHLAAVRVKWKKPKSPCPVYPTGQICKNIRHLLKKPT